MTADNHPPSKENAPGSPEGGEPEFLAVGKLGRPHGVSGDILMTVLTDFPERLVSGSIVYVGQDHRPLRIKKVRWHQKRLLLSLEGYRNRETVAALRNLVVSVRTDDRPDLPDGDYYHHQILGSRVTSDQGHDLGHLVEILETGANDVYVIRSEAGPDILLPAIEKVILEIDPVRREILVHLLPGLLPES